MNARILKPARLAAIVTATAAIFLATPMSSSELPRRALAGGGGEIITVTTLDDVSDFSGAQTVSDLPGPDGLVSFREAVTAANNTAGPQTIAFAIPSSTFWLDPNVALLRLEHGAFILKDSGTTIDFSTQTANIGDTNPSGPEVGIYGMEPDGVDLPAIDVNGDNCVIKGLGKVLQRGYAVQIAGNNNRVIGCQIDGPLHAAISISGIVGGALAFGNIVGGTGSGDGNSLSGVVIDGQTDGNIVTGNPLIKGVTVQGATQFGAIASNNRIVSNVISGAGSYSDEGFPTGVQVSVIDADGTIVDGNYIGTTADGMSSYAQIGPVGVEVRDSRGTAIRNNVIAGLRVDGHNRAAGLIFGQAVFVNAVDADTSGTLIQANTIGLAVNGFTRIETYSGITVSPASSLHHATGTLISSNHIAKVETTGVVVGPAESGVTITANAIHNCGGLAIDLGGDGPTANDPGDGDTGSNHLQNFPVLLSATSTVSGVVVQGFLDSTPSAKFTIELFLSPSCGLAGFGEGAAFVGSTIVTTDSTGRAVFLMTAPGFLAPGSGATATATATNLSTGDTSEFSACKAIAAAGVPIVMRSTAIDLSAAPQGNAITVTGDVVVRNTEGAGVPGVAVSATWLKPGGATVTLTATTNSAGIARFIATGGPGTYTLTINNATAAGYVFDPGSSVLSKSITPSPGRRRPLRPS